MAKDRDFNDVLEDIFLSEESQHKQSYEQGFKAGSEAGNPEGYHLGYHRGGEIGRELGYYQGIVSHYIVQAESNTSLYTEKIITQLNRVKELLDSFPRTNSDEHDIVGMLETVRGQYKKACALLKIPSGNPYAGGVSF